MFQSSWAIVEFFRNAALLLGFLGASILLLIVLMFLVRFLRPKHVKAILSGGLPEFDQVAGKLEVLGQSLEASAKVDSAMRRQIGALKDRIDALERSNRIQEQALRSFTKLLRESGGPNDQD